jgi:hypothetical protein
MKNLLRCFLVIGFVLNGGVFAQPELDTSFSGDGRTSVIFGALATTQDMAIQPDNKIILVSPCNHINYNRIPFCAVRVNEDGSFDSTFSSNTPAAPARFKGNGSSDPSYSGDGYLDVPFSSSSSGARAVAMDYAGRVVVAGVSSSCCVNTYWEQPVFSIMRLAAPAVRTVSISGRVIGPNGNGVSNITVSTQGVSARTNPFGYYVLRVQTNQTYTISARSKDEMSFGKRRVTVDDDISGLDIYGTN